MVKLTGLKSIDEVIEEHRGADLEFRERWDRARFASAVGVKIIQYRTEQGLTQTELAKQVGTSQSVISRLELGEKSPTLATLVKLSARTGLEFHLDIVDGDVALSA